LLQLPVGGILDQQPCWLDTAQRIDMSYSMGALINVYDHGGQTSLEAGAQAAAQLLNYVFNPSRPGVWKTRSREIRDWWLQRERRALSSIVREVGNGRVTLRIGIVTGALRASTEFSDEGIALRIKLTDALAVLAEQRTEVMVDGMASSEFQLQGNELLIRVGPAANVVIQLGSGS